MDPLIIALIAAIGATGVIYAVLPKRTNETPHVLIHDSLNSAAELIPQTSANIIPQASADTMPPPLANVAKNTENVLIQANEEATKVDGGSRRRKRRQTKRRQTKRRPTKRRQTKNKTNS